MSEVSKRDNQGKPQLSFILQFPTAIAAHARVKELGAIKYERDNWKKGGKPDHEYLDACLRHISAFMEGETFATDTGCTHLGHAMWNIMALQDLNYPGITHDEFIFNAMAEYWETRRAAEKRGETFNVSPEDFLELRRSEEKVKTILFETGEPGIGFERRPNGFKPTADGRHVDGQGEIDMDVHKVHGKLLPPLGQDPLDIAKKVVQMADEPDEAARAAAVRLLDKVLDDGKPMSSFEINAPGLAETFSFDEPLTVKNGQSLNFDLNERTAQVVADSGEVLATTGLTVTETSDFVMPTVDPDEPIDVNLWPQIDMDLPAERFEPLPGSGTFTLQEASEQLSAVMGTSVAQSMSAIQSVMDSFDPLDSLFAGHVTTTLEDGELIGKTNRSVEDLRAEAEANIAKHTELNAKEAAMEKKIIASRSFQRLIREREQASYRKGYEAAQEDYRLPDVGQCDDPDCRCNA